MAEIVVRYFHFVGILMLMSSLVGIHILTKPEISRAVLKRVSILDRVYGASAIITLVAGALLWLSVGKPASFYSANGIFHFKLFLFLLVGLISIWPTIFFLKQRKLNTENITVPLSIRVLINIQMGGVLLIPLLAVLMSRGIGLASY